MKVLDLIYGKKEEKDLIQLRIQRGKNFQNIINAKGITSFRFQVGDDDGNNTDKLILITENPINYELQGFLLEGSLTDSHTAKDLMSIGFKQILIVTNNGSGIGSSIDLKDYGGW